MSLICRVSAIYDENVFDTDEPANVRLMCKQLSKNHCYERL